MPKRRDSVAPQTEMAVLRYEVAELRRQINTMRQPGATVIQTDDVTAESDPVQGQLTIHHPGEHTSATVEGLQYYHDGAWRGVSGGGETGPTSLVVKRISSGTSGDFLTLVGSAVLLTGYYVSNTHNAGLRYVKFYNKASTPDPSADTSLLLLSVGIIPLGAANVSFDDPIEFTSGLGIAIVTGIADTDETLAAANTVTVNVFYRTP